MTALYSGTCLKRPPLGPKLLAALDMWSYYTGSTECDLKESFRTTESGHNREVVALYRWLLEQVPLYLQVPALLHMLIAKSYAHSCSISMSLLAPILANESMPLNLTSFGRRSLRDP